jgi:cytochrome c oxidase subunit II
MQKLFQIFSAACLLALTGCDEFITRQSTLDPKGPVAAAQYDVFMVTVWVTLFIFITVGSTLLWVVIRFKEKPSDKGRPILKHGHGNPLVELSLIGASILLLAIIAVPTVQTIWLMDTVPSAPEHQLQNWYSGDVSEEEESNVLVINVIGFQWWFQFEYPQLGIVTANEMVIPLGKAVRLNLRSADVIHSFWLPKIAGKVDLIPGRSNYMWIQGDEVGHYYGQCAEFCGSAHAYMLFRADVLSIDDFTAWVQHQKKPAAKPTTPLAIEGEKLFTTKTCVLCHTIDGNPNARGIKGPNLTHVASRVSLAAGILDNRIDHEGVIDLHEQSQNLFMWIQRNDELKPGNLMYHDLTGGLKNVTFTDEEVHALVAYLQTLQ